MNDQHKQLNLSPAHEKLIIAVIMCIVPILGMAIDLISPSLPAISTSLQISNAASKNLVSIYLFGFGLGNFGLGLLSDSFGRKNLSIIGFIIFILASLLPAIFPSVIMLFLGRFLQGLSLGAVAVVRSVLSDILPKDKIVKIATLIATMWGLGPVIGPIIGGYLQYYIGWQAGFYFFAIYGVLILIAIIAIIPETHFHRQPLKILQIKTNILTILSHAQFLGVVLLMGVTYSTLIIFHTLGPFLIQKELHYSAIYFGHAALWMGSVFLVGTMICRQLVKRYSPEHILYYALPSFLFVGMGWLLLSYIFPLNISVIVIPCMLMFFGCGIIYPVSMGRAMSLFQHLAGSSLALMNLINVLITSACAFFMSFINATSIIPLSWLYLILMLLSCAIYAALILRHKE